MVVSKSPRAHNIQSHSHQQIQKSKLIYRHQLRSKHKNYSTLHQSNL